MAGRGVELQESNQISLNTVPKVHQEASDAWLTAAGFGCSRTTAYCMGQCRMLQCELADQCERLMTGASMGTGPLPFDCGIEGSVCGPSEIGLHLCQDPSHSTAGCRMIMQASRSREDHGNAPLHRAGSLHCSSAACTCAGHNPSSWYICVRTCPAPQADAVTVGWLNL